MHYPGSLYPGSYYPLVEVPTGVYPPEILDVTACIDRDVEVTACVDRVHDAVAVLTTTATVTTCVDRVFAVTVTAIKDVPLPVEVVVARRHDTVVERVAGATRAVALTTCVTRLVVVTTRLTRVAPVTARLDTMLTQTSRVLEDTEFGVVVER
jgi:hypothetical protein